MAEIDNVGKEYVSVFSTNNLTVPNFLTCIRILLIIRFSALFFCSNYLLAFSVLLLSGITDVLDGFIARKFNQISQLGKYLDPLADKLTLFSVGLCVAFIFPIIIPIICLLVLKEFIMILGAVYLMKKEINPPPAQWFGKAATVAFYISSLISVLIYISGIELYWFVVTLFSVTFILMTVAVMGYYKIFKKLLKSF